MNRNEFRKFWHLHRDQQSIRAYRGITLQDGREFLDVVRHLCWTTDRLEHRASMARFHGAKAALQMTARR